MKTARRLLLAAALTVAALTGSATTAHATSRPPWNGVIYRYTKIGPNGVRLYCTVYWNGSEYCREADTGSRNDWTPFWLPVLWWR